MEITSKFTERKEHLNFKNRLGETFLTKEGYIVKIIQYIDANNILVEFNDNFKTSLKVQYGQLRIGLLKNPNHTTLSGVGYLGQGVYKSVVNGKVVSAYAVWSSIIRRCYDPMERKNNPTYIDVTVCEEWHNYQNFAKWHEENYNPETMKGWHLDKDILVKGNRVYSPETCCFVPNEVNALFKRKFLNKGEYPVGVTQENKTKKFIVRLSVDNIRKYLGLFGTQEEAVEIYKKAKEDNIKRMADKWKDLITTRV